MNIWTPEFRQQLLCRKAVPEGSDEFQRVLEDIICDQGTDIVENIDSAENIDSTENIDSKDEKVHSIDYHGDKGLIRVHDQECIDGDDHQNTDEGEDNRCLVTQVIHLGKTNSNDNNNNNNNNFCGLCTSQGKVNSCNLVCSSNFITKNSTCAKLGAVRNSNFSSPPEIAHLATNMGASCSSNLNDRHDLQSAKKCSGVDSTKHKKRALFPKRRSSGERKSDPKNVPSNACKSQQQHENCAENEELSDKPSLQTNGIKAISNNGDPPLLEDVFAVKDEQLNSNQVLPDTENPTQTPLSNIVDSTEDQANTGGNVSPHTTLLAKINHSPNGRVASLDIKSTDLSYYQERPRSHSWSNGKLGTRVNFRATNSTLRSSFTSASRYLKVNPSTLKASKLSPTSQTKSSKCHNKPISDEPIEPDCPVNMKQEVTKASISGAQVKQEDDREADLAPVSRRRAASESQTMRSRRILSHTPDSIDDIPEQFHVRWADEEKGSSLSTSVFLTSIRPRSYSHGAMDNVPHRPILKKVTGF